MAARETQPQVYPLVTHFHALFTYMRAGFLDFDLIQMGALISHFRLSRSHFFPRQVTFVM
jgi:hypothetical protein